MTVMDLVIQTLSGTTFDLRVSPYETVMSVKARIQTHEGIPISQQHLVFRNCELKDDYCLSDYAIQNGATLKLVLAMRGGPINTKRISIDDETTSNSAYETAPSAADFAEFVDTDYLVEHLSDGMSGGDKLNASSNQSNSKMALLVFRDGDQVSFFRVVDRGDGTLTPLSESAGAGSNLHNYEDDEASRLEEVIRRTATANDFVSGLHRRSDDESDSSDSFSSDLRAVTRASGNQTALSFARSGSIPPSSSTATRPSVCAYCSRFANQQQSLASTAQSQPAVNRSRSLMNVNGVRRSCTPFHLPECPFRNSTEALKRFKENEDLRMTVRALRSKMAGLKLNRERARARGDEDDLRTQSEPPKPLSSRSQKLPTETAKPSPPSEAAKAVPPEPQPQPQPPPPPQPQPEPNKSTPLRQAKPAANSKASETPRSQASSSKREPPKQTASADAAGSSLGSKFHFGTQVHSTAQPASPSTTATAAAKAANGAAASSGVPPIKGRLTPLRAVFEQQADAAPQVTATDDELAALEASRILSSLKRRHQVLEPIGVTRLRSGSVGVGQPVRARSGAQKPLAPAPGDTKAPAAVASAAPAPPAMPSARAAARRVPSGSHRLPPLASPGAAKDENVESASPRTAKANAPPSNASAGSKTTAAATAAAAAAGGRNAPQFGDTNAIASLNASIKNTIAASIDMLSSFQQTAPLEKPPPPAGNSKQRCAFCGRKTGLATSYICRCELNFCSLHRYAEAHNCTFDYKTEGRRTLQQQNPLVAAPKLPKI